MIKVGRIAAKKAWKIARPYVKRAIKEGKKYRIDGPASRGERLFQIRRGKNIVFRLDYGSIKHGRPKVLHYHIPPNIKNHHVIR